MKPTIALACDHGGLELKNHIKQFLENSGYTCTDYGTHTQQSCDYSDYAKLACAAVQNKTSDLALLFCGTGVGISIAANKMSGIRACCCSDTFSAAMTRCHNDANALCLGGRVVGFGLAEALVTAFLTAEFEGGRHQTRIDKVRHLEQEQLAR